MAEREGFEPSIRLPVCRLSKAVQSTTLPPLRRSIEFELSLILPSAWISRATLALEGRWVHDRRSSGYDGPRGHHKRSDSARSGVAASETASTVMHAERISTSIHGESTGMDARGGVIRNWLVNRRVRR